MTTLRSSPTQLSPLKVPTIVITSPPASSISSLSSSSSFPPFTLTDKSYPPSVSGAPNPSHYLLPTSFSFGKRGIISSSSSTTPTGFPSHRRFSSRTSTAATAAHRLLIVMLGSLIVLLALSSFLDGFAFAAAGAQRTLLSISIPSVDHKLAAEQPPLLLLKRFEVGTLSLSFSDLIWTVFST